MERSDFREIKTKSWHTLEYLSKVGDSLPLNPVFHNLPEGYDFEPLMSRVVRNEFWLVQLNKRKEEVEKKNPGIKLEISHDYTTGSPSLYEKVDYADRTIMFDGWNTNTTLAEEGYKIEDDQLIISNKRIPYSKWIACLDPRYGEGFEKYGLPLPYAGLGISTLIIPSDGLVPLTRRDVRTAIYPGMLYCPGGGVKPGMDSAEAAIDEIVDETGLKRHIHFNPNNILPAAFVADTHHMGTRHSRPEVLYTLKTDISSKDVTAAYVNHVKAKGKEPDVNNIEHHYADSVDSTISTIRMFGPEMCPPTAASFAYLLYDQLLAGEDSEEKAFEKLRAFVTSLNF